jgi:hypothetical protein
MRRTALALSACLAPVTLAQPTMPNDFEAPGASLASLFSYFGGVSAYGTRPAAVGVYSGNSLEVWANFQHDNFFRIAGFAVGKYNMTAPALSVPANASTLSVTVAAPASGQLSMDIALREDDDADGVASADSDDSWETGPVMLLPGTNVYNIPLANLILGNEGSGNGVRNLTTTGVMSVVLTFESRTTYPGGIIEHPVSFHIDHLGLFDSPQTLPTPACPADLDDGSGTGTPDGGVTVDDLVYFVTAFGAGSVNADLDNGSGTGTPDGGVTIDDLVYFLTRFEGGC